MPRDSLAYLWDARRALTLIAQFVSGRSWADYERDALLRSGVERQFEILGEALNRLDKLEPAIGRKISDLPRIVAFRNVLIHGYAAIDDRLVWEVATARVGPLSAVLDELLGDRE